jgi:hypothetical protein
MTVQFVETVVLVLIAIHQMVTNIINHQNLSCFNFEDRIHFSCRIISKFNLIFISYLTVIHF